MRSSTPLLLAAVALTIAGCGGPSDKGAGAAAPSGAASTSTGGAQPATQTIALNTPPTNPHLLSGWSAPEAGGVWNLTTHPVLQVPHPQVAEGGALKVTLDALTYLPTNKGFQRAEVTVNGEKVTELKLYSVGYSPVSFSVPGRLLKAGQPLDIAFDLPDAKSPSVEQPGSLDKRQLGLGVRSVTVGG